MVVHADRRADLLDEALRLPVSWTVTRVSVSLSLWNVTTPAWSSSPPVEFQATRSSGCCSVMLASNVRSMPPILTFHSVSVSVTCVIDST